ncbi:MAG: glycerophosphodiester phosphodiesterase [Desulfobacterales bacterium]|nr:glycerophosphodiester phosphodiesterase [Desulfobacterales bacterium]
MGLPAGAQRRVLKLIDHIYAGIPRPIPDREKLEGCRIISHRGAHDNRTVFENTLAAFDRIRDAGVWGIEFDIRWTRDLHPVVIHDASLQRLYGDSRNIRELTLSELKSSVGMIPTLKEVIDRYAKKLHLMVELKKEVYPDPVYQSRVLNDLFAGLEPAADFHFLSLTPELFKMIAWLPAAAFLPIAEFNVARISDLSIRENYGGILGHYLLLAASVLKKHQDHHQKVGTGFVNSERCLFRELNRGVHWIFSDNAVGLQTLCSLP